MQQRGFAHLLVLLVILIAAVSGAYYLGTMKKVPTPTPSSSLSPSSTPNASDETVYTDDSRSANWNIFKNFELKYQVGYPKSFELSPQTEKEKSQIGDTSRCFAKKGSGLCQIMISGRPLPLYKLVDESGGFIFRFDSTKAQWVHIEDSSTSEFVPKRAQSVLEAYIYRTGDIKCASQYTLIPNPGYTIIIEIVNKICRDDNGNLLKEYEEIPTDQILSTFRFN